MDFLYPIYFAGALAAAVPVLIHLLTRRQRKKLLFSDLTLLRKVDAEERARYSWEHLRLMVLRAILCMILALLFAQPVLKMGQGVLRQPGQGNVAAFIIDTSRSMAASEGGVLRFEKARQNALEVLDLMRGEDEAIVIFASSRIRMSHAEPTSFRDEVREAIEQAEVTPYGSAMSLAVQRAVELLLKSPFSNREIYLFTDGQKSALESIPTQWPERTETLTGYLGYYSEALNLPNLELTNLSINPTTAKTGEPMEVGAEIVPHGDEVPSSVEVDLEIGPTHRLHRTLPMAVDQMAPVGFPSFSRSAEPVEAGTMRLQADVLASDNDIHYAVPEGRPIKILISQGSGDDRVLTFLQVVLRILAKQPFMPPLQATYAKIRDIPEKISQEPVDVIFILDPGRVDADWIRDVSLWMQDGGNMVLGLGGVVGNWINDLLVPQWIPANIRRWEVKPEEAARPASLDFNHPWLDRFQNEEAADFRSVKVWGGWEYASTTPNASLPVRNLIMLDRGSPLIWERTMGLGSLTVNMSSLSYANTDLPKTGLFLALWGEYFRSLAERKGIKPYYLAGEQVPIEVVRRDDKAAEIRVVYPNGEEQSLVSGGTKLTQTLIFSGGDEIGHYKLSFDNERIERVTPAGFAVNVEPGEGDLEAFSVEELRELFPFTIESFDGGKSLASQLMYSRYGYSLWPFVLLIVLFGMMLEAWWGRPT